MTLSRTARILIALLLVAAAAFVWINFFQRAPDTQPASPTVESPAQPGVAAPSGATDPTGTTPSVADPSAPDATGAAGADAPSTDGAPTVVATPQDAVAGREVQVAELPFLVDQPPPEEADVPETAEGDAEGAPGPEAEARASVNPFSPIVVPQTAASATTAEAARPDASGSPDVVDVTVPSGPDVATVVADVPVPSAPAPRALAPAGSPSARLPRAIGGGMLPVAPEVLTGSRSEPVTLAPIDISAVTAVREPSTPTDAPRLPALRDEASVTDGDPAPLSAGAVPPAGTPDRPIAAGTDGLARYLRDRNVTFTGSVVGSVGVGVFRLAGTSAPIVLALGQALPDSEIVLTDLRGQSAEFTLGDTTHVLTLDLRR